MSNDTNKSIFHQVADYLDDAVDYISEKATDLQLYAEETYEDLTSYEVTITKKPKDTIQQQLHDDAYAGTELADKKYPY